MAKVLDLGSAGNCPEADIARENTLAEPHFKQGKALANDRFHAVNRRKAFPPALQQLPERVYRTRMRLNRQLLAGFLCAMVSFQAVAGVAGGACRHAAKSADAAVESTASEHAHHAHHATAADEGQVDRLDRPASSLSGCGCGCDCSGTCVHACHLSVLGSRAAATVERVRSFGGAVTASALRPHTQRLLRPPASLRI